MENVQKEFKIPRNYLFSSLFNLYRLMHKTTSLSDWQAEKLNRCHGHRME